MKIFEIVAAAKAANPEAFGRVDGPRATKIVIAALQEIGKKIEATAEGTVVVLHFGRFVVKRGELNPVTATTPGAASTLTGKMSTPRATGAARRIIFHPMNLAAAAAKAPKKA